MKTTRTGVAILGVAAIALMTPAFAAPTPEAPAQPGAGNGRLTKEQAFQGKIEAINSTEKTFTVSGQMYYVTASTKIMHGDKMLTMNDLKMGDEVSGTGHQTFDGKTAAVTVRVVSKN